MSEIDLLNEHVAGLRMRAGRCVCRYCGGTLELREIVYSNCETARTQMYCQKCGRMEYGCEPEVYAASVAYQEKTRFDSYKDMADSELKTEMNRAQLCDFLTWSLEALGLLDDDGFTVDVNVDKARLTGIMTWTPDELA